MTWVKQLRILKTVSNVFVHKPDIQRKKKKKTDNIYNMLKNELL